MAAGILETIDNALADCTSPDAMRWRPEGGEGYKPPPPAGLTMADLCTWAYYTISPRERQDSRTRWVMDLASYKHLRAECEAVTGRQADPDTYVPDPGDMLFAIRIDVRDHGGEPHLETPARLPDPPWALLSYRLAELGQD